MLLLLLLPAGDGQRKRQIVLTVGMGWPVRLPVVGADWQCMYVISPSIDSTAARIAHRLPCAARGKRIASPLITIFVTPSPLPPLPLFTLPRGPGGDERFRARPRVAARSVRRLWSQSNGGLMDGIHREARRPRRSREGRWASECVKEIVCVSRRESVGGWEIEARKLDSGSAAEMTKVTTGEGGGARLSRRHPGLVPQRPPTTDWLRPSSSGELRCSNVRLGPPWVTPLSRGWVPILKAKLNDAFLSRTLLIRRPARGGWEARPFGGRETAQWGPPLAARPTDPPFFRAQRLVKLLLLLLLFLFLLLLVLLLLSSSSLLLFLLLLLLLLLPLLFLPPLLPLALTLLLLLIVPSPPLIPVPRESEMQKQLRLGSRAPRRRDEENRGK